ncbi:His Kinase A (phospho-acceptor) domain-containing protein [Bradyrhizobium lablabi]|uniref:histidine kinase n=2 Tax=Bradyrhizobium lablabi TaxID=722472 RepID=A0A1M7DJS7_9BRAD|nr:His Kinase A (phospho-acceptor) domain-containing protein [Bradyrhizobium lablabi]
MVPKPAKARARPVGSGNEGVLQPDDELTAYRVLRADVLPLLLSLLSVGLVTAVLLPLDKAVAASLVPVAYLIPVIVAATRWGIWPATLTSIAGMAAADFFFFPPLFSFRVDDPQEVIDLLVFLVVALVSSNLASRLRQETDAVRRRETEILQLYEFSRRLAACFTVSDLIAAIENYLSRTLGQQVVFFAAGADDRFEPPDSGSVPTLVRDRVAAMPAKIGDPAHAIVNEATQDVWLLGTVSSETAVHGLVAVNIGDGSREAVALKTRRVESILEEVSMTLQRLHIEKAMADARLHLQAQLLRDAFHGTLSHELCTPLAAIRGSASVMDSMPDVRGNGPLHSLVEAISDEAAQLDGFIRNLLNATRVTAGGVSPRLEWADPRDIVNAAVKGRARQLLAHEVEVEFGEDLPLVNVDSGLIEESCGQLLENAAKYSPSGSTISIRARAEADRVVLSISDQGVGITPDERQQLGLRSFRSQRHRASIPGSGLGFWIASTFVKANGGTIDVSSRGQGQGTTASIALPGASMEPSELAALRDE